ncbi:flagellar hook-length control protein FliK [Marinobacter lipolyticus]|uniref:flagellar hook-length control protein FliK n=1 Tax=Marinobacter lipolyticus TaxID=209639 RepID=UPI00056930EB
MKLPNGNPTPPPSGEQTRLPASGAARDPQLPASTAVSARQQLDQLQLANREVALARVAEVLNRQQGAAQQLMLDVRGRSLTVQAAIGDTTLETGDWVKVMRAGNELQLMGKLAQTQEAGIARALAQRLPWQQSIEGGLARMLSALAQGTRQEPAGTTLPSAQTPQPLAPSVRQAIEQLVNRLPGTTSLATSGSATEAGLQVRQWIAESGLFAEARLAQSREPTLPDLKLALGRIITALLSQQGSGPEQFNRLTPLATPELVQAPLQFPNILTPPAPQSSAEPPTVGQMLRLLAGMLNRITVNQLHSQVLSTRTTADTPAPVSTLLLELPWVTPQNEPRIAQLRIEHENPEGDPAGKKRAASIAEWRLSLAMDLDDAGPVHFDVALRQEQISARVWAEKQSTLRQVQQELPTLRQSLSELGLEVTDLDCRRGSPQGSTTRLEHRLVDTKA